MKAEQAVSRVELIHKTCGISVIRNDGWEGAHVQGGMAKG